MRVETIYESEKVKFLSHPCRAWAKILRSLSLSILALFSMAILSQGNYHATNVVNLKTQYIDIINNDDIFLKAFRIKE